MVCWAAALAEQVKTTARPKSTAPMRRKNFAINIDPAFDIANAKTSPDWFFDLIVAESPLSEQNWHSAIVMSAQYLAGREDRLFSQGPVAINLPTPMRILPPNDPNELIELLRQTRHGTCHCLLV
jgi:hypothetical protein